jgi:cytochrome c
VLALAVLSLGGASAEVRDPGERAYQKCYSCHSVDPAETGLSGPTLAGVVGRRAAAVPGFDYSPAMRQAARDGLVWTEAELDRYLADPLEVIPGTSMSFPGLRDPAERRAVIAYLRRFR